MSTSKKQQVLDMEADNDKIAALQMILRSFSKTRTEQLRRIFNEIGTVALYKTKYRMLPFIDVWDIINQATNLHKDEQQKEGTNETDPSQAMDQ